MVVSLTLKHSKSGARQSLLCYKIEFLISTSTIFSFT